MYRCESPKVKRRILASSLCVNLGLLGLFKYYNFFVTEFFELCSLLGVPAHAPTLQLILPVGISFYTFQSVGYLIDVYYGRCKPCSNFLDYAAFVSFFPQLVAGPIERYSSLMPQFQSDRQCSSALFQEGVWHILRGMFTKVFVADNLAPYVNAVFSEHAAATGSECFLAIVCFAFQIYGDFAGYSSIAQGVANLLGFRLMYNFNVPYVSRSPSEFWQRWHISLSSWLRDFVYIPLGGNRHSEIVTYRNLLLTMTIGGLWHGANWTFLAWGLFHGAILCIYRWLGVTSTPVTSMKASLGALGQWMIMSLLTLFGWLLFRAESLGQVGDMCQQIVFRWEWSSYASFMLGNLLFFALPLFLLDLLVVRCKNPLMPLSWSWRWQLALYLLLLLCLLFFVPDGPHEFIYFQF